MDITPRNAFRFGFFACLILFFVYLGAFAFAVFIENTSSANINELSLLGHGNVQIRTDTKMSSDFASAQGADIAYESKRTWGISGEPETFTNSFMIASASSDGKWKNAYRIKGSGAGHKVDFKATKISGNASFASTITLSATEAQGPSFDSVVEFDTRDGKATISGRVYNSTAGRPATMQELDVVGAFLLQHHLNVSQPIITPESWLPSCSELDKDMILDPSTKGIYVAPLNDSKYNYVWDGLKVFRRLNTTR